MTYEQWAKVSILYWKHPKVVRAGIRAATVNQIALFLCIEHGTDGRLTPAVIREALWRAEVPTKRRREVIRTLVESTLWDEGEDGLSIHDFLDWQRTNDEVEAQRESWRIQKRNQRSRVNGTNVRTGLQHGLR